MSYLENIQIAASRIANASGIEEASAVYMPEGYNDRPCFAVSGISQRWDERVITVVPNLGEIQPFFETLKKKG